MASQAQEPGFSTPHHDALDTASPGPAAGLPNWDRLSQRVAFALSIHAAQTRKGTDTPYIPHPLAVTGIVLDDAVEDQGAHQEPVI